MSGENFDINYDNIKTLITIGQEVFVVDEGISQPIQIEASDVLIRGSTQDISLFCSSSEVVGDIVYVSGDLTVSKASNTNISTAKAIGIIVQKSNDTNCRVRFGGVVQNLTGLEAGELYHLGTSGNLTRTIPTDPLSVIVKIGIAISATKLLLIPINNFIIRT